MDYMSSGNERDSVSSGSSDSIDSDVGMIMSSAVAVSQNPTTYENDLEYIAQAVAGYNDDGPSDNEYTCGQELMLQQKSGSAQLPLLVKPSLNDSNSDDDSESSESENNFQSISKPIKKSDKMEIQLEDLCTEEEDTVPFDGLIRTKNEINPPVSVIPPEAKVEIGDEIVAVGLIHSYIESDNALVIKSYLTNNPLAEKSMLCVKKGNGSANEFSMIGTVCEVFGPLSTPFYVVRWSGEAPHSGPAPTTNKSNRKNKKNSADQKNVDGSTEIDSVELVIPSADIVDEPTVNASVSNIPVVIARPMKYDQGTVVYSVKRLMEVIVPELIIKATGKGSDASNLFDEEVRYVSTLK